MAGPTPSNVEAVPVDDESLVRRFSNVKRCKKRVSSRVVARRAITEVTADVH